jgi:histidine triad (HIT) family protein
MTLPLPEVGSCYLCDIASGDGDDWNVVSRSDLTMTVLNGRQFEIGQCIVFPIRHAPTILDLTPTEEAAIMAAAKELTKVFVRAYSPDGVLLYQNNGTGSGQEVPHFHLHVVPRRPKSNWGIGPPHLARLEQPSRPAHLDHTVVTPEKRDEVASLKRHFRRR